MAHTSKAASGNAQIDQRPMGGDKGFPSTHTAAAAFVGASRIDARRHDIWQVLAGGLLGWGADRALRRPRTRMLAKRSVFVAQTWIAAILRRLITLTRGNSRTITAFGAALVLVASVNLARAEVELSFYGGVQSAPHSTIKDSVLGEARVRWLGKSFATPPYYGVRATWWTSEKWGFGVEVNHAKVYAENKTAVGYETLEFTDGLNLVTANVFRRFPTDGRFTPYIGGGLGIAVPHVEIERIGESKTFEYQMTGPAATLVFGTSYEISDKWSIFAEYKGSYSMNKAKVDAGGTLKTNIVTNALNLGVSFSF